MNGKLEKKNLQITEIAVGFAQTITFGRENLPKELGVKPPALFVVEENQFQVRQILVQVIRSLHQKRMDGIQVITGQVQMQKRIGFASQVTNGKQLFQAEP